MKIWHSRTLGISMLALGGAMGCADLVGADFDDLHPRSRSNEYDAARRPDAPNEDGPDKNTANPPRDNPDATSEQRPMAGDGAPGADDAGFDRRDIGHGFDVIGDLDAGRAHDMPDIDDPGPSKDASDDLDAGHTRDRDDTANDAHSRDVGDATDGGSAVDVRSDPPPDGAPPTVVVGGFVSLGAPNRTSSSIELRGHVISNAAVRGVTSTGISIEGKIQ